MTSAMTVTSLQPRTIPRPSANDRHHDPQQADAFGRQLDARQARSSPTSVAQTPAYPVADHQGAEALKVGSPPLLWVGMLPAASGWIGHHDARPRSKLLDGVEISHDVMHGQFDSIRAIQRSRARLGSDFGVPSTISGGSRPRHARAYTSNILDMDRDIGSGILRIDEDQEVVACSARPGVRLPADGAVPVRRRAARARVRADRLRWGQAQRQRAAPLPHLGQGQAADAKDYVAFPLLPARSHRGFHGRPDRQSGSQRVVVTIIFSATSPGRPGFSIEATRSETRGQWYFRQVLGSATSPAAAVPHPQRQPVVPDQHHLFPDIPPRHAGDLAARFRRSASAPRPLQQRPLPHQFATVVQDRQALSASHPVTRWVTAGSRAPGADALAVTSARVGPHRRHGRPTRP